MEFSTLNWLEEFVFDDEFNDMFATEYETFPIDDEPQYDVFKFDACIVLLTV